MDKKDMLYGWDFAASLAGVNYSADAAHSYVEKVADAIAEMENNINNHPYRGQAVPFFKGYVAEEWHSGTFNIDAVAAGSEDRAAVQHLNSAGSVDIHLDSGADYSAKVYTDGTKSAIAQSAVSADTGEAAYQGQHRLIPLDQMPDATAEAHRQALRNVEIRPNVAAAYSDTEANLTATVKNDEGISSIAKDRKDFETMAEAGKKQNFHAEDAGVNLESAIRADYILKQAIQAGYTAAAITVAIQLAPEIYKSIDYLIKTGKIDVQRIKSMGIKGVTAGAEGFLRGSVACSVQIMCEQGALGVALKAADPTMVGAVVAIVMGTVKNSILVAAGKMTATQMGAAFVDSAVVTVGYIAGAKIGGAIGQALGFQLPVVGYLIGSMVGCAFATVYNIGKKKLISFCVDTGFTCFGLVEQDYSLPEEVLGNLGISTIQIPRTQVARTQVQRTTVQRTVDRAQYETININMVRRGVIGVNKVGYIL